MHCFWTGLDSNDKSSRQGSSLYRRQSSVNTPLVHQGSASASSVSGGSNTPRYHAGLSRDNLGGIGGRGLISSHVVSSRATGELAHDGNISHSGIELSGRRLQQKQHQMNGAVVSNVSGGSFQTSGDLDDSGSDSLMSQLFGTTAPSLSLSGQGDIGGGGVSISRPHQPIDNCAMEADVTANTSAVCDLKYTVN